MGERSAGLGEFVTLTLLEIVLGIDNLVFMAILAGRLPAQRRIGRARWDSRSP